LDKVTSKVRAFYETYPYPPGGAVDTDGYHARLLLSYIERTQERSDRLQVLEAGCGRGLNLIAAAGLQPDVDFTGIDINRVAIQEAQQKTAEMGLSNLRFAEADLLDPATIPSINDGYNLILSYGVIHHLSDPLQGLKHLRERLSTEGVVGIMVDGRYGRQPLDRFRETLSMLGIDQASSRNQQMARALAEVAEQDLFKGTYWQGTVETDEVEFADRCQHVHENSYDIDSLNQLLEDAGLGFVRWLESADWCLDEWTQDVELQNVLAACDEHQRYALVERLFDRPKLSFIAADIKNPRRAALKQIDIAETRFRINPQMKLSKKEHKPSCCRLRQRRVEIKQPWVDAILSLSKLLKSDMSGDDICRSLSQHESEYRSIEQTLMALEEAELIYRPNTPDAIEAD
jgi:SAM-dependent methyltransferase